MEAGGEGWGAWATTSGTMTTTTPSVGSGSSSLPSPQQSEENARPPPPSSSSLVGLAKDGALLFQAQRYTECLRVLGQLLLKKEDDPKVLHNIAVAEYYRDGCTDPHRLLDVLAKVKARSEELARAAEEQLEGVGTTTLNSQSGSLRELAVGSRSNASGGGGGAHMQSSTGLGLGGEAVAYMEDYDTSIPTLNTGVILYHLQQHAAALSVLEPLYQNIEPIDETAALRVCLLIMDITLSSGRPGKAAAVLQTMEKSFGNLISPGEGGVPVQSQSPVQTQFLNTAGVALVSGDSSNLLSSVGPSSLVTSPSGELGLNRTSSEEVLDEDTLTLSLDVEGSHASTSVVPLPLSPGLARVPSVEKVLPAPVVDLKLMLHLYKVRLLMLTRNLKATKREVKSALNLSRDHLTALLLKAQLEYSRANYRKAIKLLTTCSSRVEARMTSLFLSNLGCIHHRLRKDQTAALFFRKALQANATISKEAPLKLNTFSQDKSLSILYNAGLQQLICGHPILAAHCFQEAGSFYYNQPLLWLRLAECCILALEKGQLETESDNVATNREEVKVSVIGDGKWRHVVLPAGSLNPTATNGSAPDLSDSGEKSFSEHSPQTDTGSFVSGQPNKLSMTFARHCLCTALHLLDKQEAKAVDVVAAEAAKVKDGDEASSSIVIQIQRSGTSDKKGNNSNGIEGAESQVSPTADGKESKVITGSSSTITASIVSFEEEKRKEQILIRQSVLADLAYVELCLQNPLQALNTASTLLLLEDCSQMYAFWGRLYAAEALCLLDRSREAADYLSVCLESSNVESTLGGEEDGKKWKSGDNSEASGDGDDSTSVSPYNLASGGAPESWNVAKVTGSRARSSLYVNLAAVYVMQGDLAQAHQWATQAVTITPANPLAVLAVVYVDLLRGQREEAITMLKHCRQLCVVSHNKVVWQRD